MHVSCFPSIISFSRFFFIFSSFILPLSLTLFLPFPLFPCPCVFYFASVVVFNSVFPFMSWRLYLKKIQFIWLLQREVVDAVAVVVMPHFTFRCSNNDFDCFSSFAHCVTNAIFFFFQLTRSLTRFVLLKNDWRKQRTQRIHMNDNENFCYFSFISCLMFSYSHSHCDILIHSVRQLFVFFFSYSLLTFFPLQKFFFQLEHISQIVRNQMKWNETHCTAQQICIHIYT